MKRIVKLSRFQGPLPSEPRGVILVDKPFPENRGINDKQFYDMMKKAIIRFEQRRKKRDSKS